jgi:hypothetical protein
MTLMLYCEPIVVELRVAMPEKSALCQLEYDPHWVESLSNIASRADMSTHNMPLMIRARDRCPDPCLATLGTGRLIERWVHFHSVALLGIVYTALDMRNNWRNGSTHFVAFELRRFKDQAASVHVCYTFGIASFKKVDVAGLGDWLESLENPPTPSQSAKLLANAQALKRSDSASLAQGLAPINHVIYLPSEDGAAEPLWHVFNADLEPCQRSPQLWLSSLPPPEQLIRDYIHYGHWLALADLMKVKPPKMKRNAWGFIQMLASR